MKALQTIIFLLVPALGCTGTISDPLDKSTNGGSGTPGLGTGTGGATTGSTTGTTSPDACASGPTVAKPRVRRLTDVQIRNTLRDQWGFVPPAVQALPGDARLDGFANRSADLLISPLLADGYYQASEELAAEVVANGGQYGIACAIANVGAGTCLNDFIVAFGQKMWRRPLAQPEVGALATLYNTASANGEGPTGGVKAVVQALFMSPNFLHRSELGTNQQALAVTPLTDYELASALSYTLWDSAPDDALFELARQGKLRDKAVLVGEAKRMFASDKTSAAMQHFMQQWLFIEELAQTGKDMTIFPTGTLEVASDLVEESRLFMNSVLFDPGGDRSFKTLFTATYGFVNARNPPNRSGSEISIPPGGTGPLTRIPRARGGSRSSISKPSWRENSRTSSRS